MLIEPIIRNTAALDSSNISQWACKTKTGDLVSITYHDGNLVVDAYEEAGYPYSFSTWKVLSRIQVKSKSDVITDAEVKFYLMREGLLEIKHWKFLLYKLFLPLIVKYENIKKRHEQFIFD